MEQFQRDAMKSTTSRQIRKLYIFNPVVLEHHSSVSLLFFFFFVFFHRIVSEKSAILHLQ